MSKEWKKGRLGEICIGESSNISQNKIQHLDGKYPIYGASGYIQNIDFYKQEKEYIGIVKDGAGVGRVRRLPAKSSILGTMQYIIPKDNTNINYLFYLLNNLNLAKYSSGATIPHIYFKDYSTEKILFPPIETQRRIAATLDKANELIVLRKKQLKELDALAEAVFYKLFGDPVKNEKGWEMMKTKSFSTVITGNTPSRDNPNYYNSDHIEWIKTDNIITGILVPTKAKEFLSKEGLIKGRFVESGSILVCCIAGSIRSIGTACITDRTVSFNQQINAITPDYKKANVLYLVNLFSLSKKYIQNNATNGMKHIITKSVLENLYFPIPPLSLQTHFATIIEKIEEQKALVRKALKESEDLFQRLMQDSFHPN